MSGIQKISDLKPASFESKRGLTKAQEELIKLLIASAKEQRIVTMDEVLEIWVKYVKKGWDRPGTYSLLVRVGEGYNFEYERVSLKVACERNNWVKSEIKRWAAQWLKLNLGSCIIKGKILAIPIIEI